MGSSDVVPIGSSDFVPTGSSDFVPTGSSDCLPIGSSGSSDFVPIDCCTKVHRQEFSSQPGQLRWE